MFRATMARPLMSGMRGILALGSIACAMALTSCCHTSGMVVDCTRYCVIDLSPGPSASRYPVSYLPEAPFWGWPDEYKTSKLVLRKILPGMPSTHMKQHMTSGERNQMHGGSTT